MDVPRGLAGVAVADTQIGDVRGDEGFYHYREYSAVELAERRSFEDVWHLFSEGRLPSAGERAAFAEAVRPLRALPRRVADELPALASAGERFEPLGALRTALSLTATDLGLEPTLDLGAERAGADGLQLVAVAPSLVAALWRLHRGQTPLEPRGDLPFAADYLYLLSGAEPPADRGRALEQYLVLTADHGFNASTFTARVIASTGADLGAALVGALGALSGPLHGGAPGRALDMLDVLDGPRDAAAYVRAAVARGERVMGFGHRVYRTVDPRARLLREIATRLGGPTARRALAIEEAIVDTLAELKPGRSLYANVEFYAGVVMDACGIPRELFTPTFALARMVGWCAHVAEQVADNRIIRPGARYVGPPAPQPVPAVDGPDERKPRDPGNALRVTAGATQETPR